MGQVNPPISCCGALPIGSARSTPPAPAAPGFELKVVGLPEEAMPDIFRWGMVIHQKTYGVYPLVMSK